MSHQLRHCTRCRCSLDVGDEAPATTAHDGPLCVCCDLILKGADPWDAMMDVWSRKLCAAAGADREARPS